MTDHDQLFKSLIETFFADFVRLVLAEHLPRFELERVRFLDKETFSEPPAGPLRVLDLVAETPTRGGDPELVLVHVEIEGQFRRAAEERLWLDYMRLRLRHRRPVVPVLVALKGGPRGLARRTVREGLGSEVTATFTYRALGVARADAAEWLARPEPLAAGLAALMRPPGGDRAAHKLACLSAVARAGIDETRELLLVNTVETYLGLNRPEGDRYAALVGATQGTEGNKVKTWAERMQAEGRRQGRLDEARKIVLSLLERRFGTVPDAARRQVAEIGELRKLERLAGRLLDARSLAELGLVEAEAG